jgi:hypothetical protein
MGVPRAVAVEVLDDHCFAILGVPARLGHLAGP